jgi:carbonic anhydrase
MGIVTMNKYVGLSVLIAGFCLSGSVLSDDKAHWTYSGEEGPEHWGELSPAYSACATGKNQSPVDLSGMIPSKLPKLALHYQAGGDKVINNGHTIQVGYAAGSDLTIAGHSFELKQFHFHAPSENTIDGKPYAMEAHFVHADKEGHLAVLALMFKEGAANSGLEKVWSHMPEEADKNEALSTPVDAAALLPHSHDYYQFSGSLTTPPCTEGVLWLVLKAHVTASKAQIEKFEHVMHHPNNRPVQPVNARMILQ